MRLPYPPYQGDFENFAKVGVIGKCLLISLIHHKFVVVQYKFLHILV
jgi:hypothetical protein